MTATTAPPVAGPGIAQPGHNQRNGYQDTRNEFVSDLANQLKGLDVWDKRETLDDDLAPRANDFVKGLKKLKTEGDASRKAEKHPHNEAAKAVDDWWKKEIDKIDKALAVITPKINAYLTLKDQERQRAEALAREQRIANERAAEDARTAAAHATSASQRIEAEARAEEAQKAAKNLAKEEKAHKEPVRVASATGLAQNTGRRKSWKYELEDRKKAVNFFLLTNPEAFDELLKQLAGEALRTSPVVDGEKQVPEIAGVKFSFEWVYK